MCIRDSRRALTENTEGSTVLIVAQRISTVMNAEQILVMDAGRIVGKLSLIHIYASRALLTSFAAGQEIWRQ